VSSPDSGAIAGAVEVLRSGGLVAFPTETVYGLGADAANPRAVERLFTVKRRPREHPVIVHVARADQLDDIGVDVSAEARALASACWPGPLTVVVRRRPGRICDEVTGGLETVGVRVPDHPITHALLAAFGRGIAAPSANRFGRVSPTTASHVRADLGDDVDLVLDGGAAAVGIESTIVDCSSSAVTLLRPGGIPRQVLEGVLGRPVAEPRSDAAGPRAPGRLASHYAPDAQVMVTDDTLTTQEACRAAVAEGKRCGVLAVADSTLTDDLPAGVVVLAPPTDTDDYARVLYSRLREADARELDVVVALAPSAGGRATAIRDRLERASDR